MNYSDALVILGMACGTLIGAFVCAAVIWGDS